MVALSPSDMLVYLRDGSAQTILRTATLLCCVVVCYIAYGKLFPRHNSMLLGVIICCLLFVGYLTSQQHASVCQGRICSDKFTCCHTGTKVADPTSHLTQSQYTDTGPTSPSADPITPGARQGSHWSANFEVTGMTRPRKNPGASGNRTWDLPLSRRTP